MKLWQQVDETMPRCWSARHGFTWGLENGWRNADKFRHVDVHQQPEPSNDISHRWKKASPGRFKCNVDASFSSSKNKAGIDMFIRDADRCILLAKTIWFSPLCSVKTDEAMWLYQVLLWAADVLHFSNMVLHSNFVVDVFHGGRNNIIEFGSIVQSCNQLFHNYFQSSVVEFSRRQANRVAHALAKVDLFIDVLFAT